MLNAESLYSFNPSLRRSGIYDEHKISLSITSCYSVQDKMMTLPRLATSKTSQAIKFEAKPDIKLPGQSDLGAKQAHLMNPINRMADLDHDRGEFEKG